MPPGDPPAWLRGVECVEPVWHAAGTRRGRGMPRKGMASTPAAIAASLRACALPLWLPPVLPQGPPPCGVSGVVSSAGALARRCSAAGACTSALARCCAAPPVATLRAAVGVGVEYCGGAGAAAFGRELGGLRGVPGTVLAVGLVCLVGLPASTSAMCSSACGAA